LDIHVLEQPLRGDILRRKADDHAVHRRLAPGLVGPGKGAVGKEYLHALGQHPAPQHAYLLPLGNGVGGDIGAANRRALHHPRRLHIPGGDKIQETGVFQIAVDGGNIGALAVVHVFGADKGRVAEDITERLRRHQGVPVHPQGVIAEDIGGGFEGNTGKVEAKFLRHPQVHLVVHQPQGHLGDLGGEFLDLDAVELVYVEVDKAVHIEGLLAAGVGSAQHFEFQQAQLPVGDHQKVATAAGRVEKAQAPQFLVELEQAVLVVLDPVKLIPEGIEKERLDELEDVLLAGVVGAE